MIVFDYGKKVQLSRVVFSPDCRLLAAVGEKAAGGSAAPIIWNTTGSEYHRYQLKSDRYVRSLMFHPDGRFLYAPTNHGLIVCQVGNRTESLVHKDTGDALAVDPSGTVFIWDRREDIPGQRHWRGMLTCAHHDGNGFQIEWEKCVVDSGSTYRLTHFPKTARFASAEYSVVDDGSFSSQYSLAIRSTDTGEMLSQVSGLKGKLGFQQLTVAPSEELIVARSRTALHTFSTADLTLPSRKISNDNRKEFTGIAFHPSGKYLAATSNDETVKLYDTSTWEVARTFTWQIGRMRSIAFSPDGTLAAAGSDSGKVVVWDVDL